MVRPSALLAFTGSLFIAGAAHATPLIYDAFPCGGAYDACTVVRTVRTPTPDQLVGLDSAAFLAYFRSNGFSAQQLPPDNSFFSFGITDSSPSYVIGHVDGTDEIHTQFVYGNGILICCTDDEPFVIRDINDNNVVVGNDPTFIDPFVQTIRGTSNGFRSDVTVLLDSVPTLGWSFLAVDDTNSILANHNGQLYDLANRVPEPSSTLLFGAGLLGLFMRRRRKAAGAVINIT